MAAGRAKGAVETPARKPATVEEPDADEVPAGQPLPARPAPRPKDAPRTMKDLRESRQGKRASRAKPAENVLRKGLRLERVPDPAILVLLGATGDLAHRKVLPALYQLWRTNLLPHEFLVLAVGRREYDDDTFRAEIRTSLEKFSRVLPLDDPAWRSFQERIRYHRLDFADAAGFDALSARLDEIDEEHGTRGNRMFYLATQPSQFAELVAQLGRVGLDHEHHDGGWRRVVIEKPFGHDLDSAKRLNREVGKVFRESQVYRIDHYLGKETVRNLLVFRFGNGIFEPLWNRRYVDHVQITVAESIGIENRGAFYEQTGASRDVLQNHLLQLVSLIAMEPPATFEADALRDEKVKVLRAIDMDTAAATDVVRGQYGPGWIAATRVPGYRQEPDVDPAVGDGDVRRRQAHDRRLALVRRPLLRPDRQAPAQALHRDRHPVPRGPAPPVPGGERRSGSEPARHPGPARRGDHAPLRGEGAGPGHGHPLGDDGLHVRVGVQRRFARCLRDADPRRAPGRRLAVHPRRRGGGGLVDRRPVHRSVGQRTRAGLPELRGRRVGPARGGRAPCSRRPPLAPVLGGATMAVDTPLKLGEPVLRWSSRAHSIAEIETELARIWADRDVKMTIEGESGRHIAARTSVMNLIVIARRPELAEHCAATMQALTGQHPSRTVIIGSADPDGPSWVDARVEAHCVLPRVDAPETCAEMIHLTAGGEAGQHLTAIATPLIVHDLPVTVWWPGEPPFGARPAQDLFASRTGSSSTPRRGAATAWSGCTRWPSCWRRRASPISDFALLRQARWREAIASIFDDPDFTPYLRSLRRVAVTYGTHDETGAPGSTNLVKPVYHIGWLASRLDLTVKKALTPMAGHGPAAASGRVVRGPGAKPVLGRSLVATLSDGRSDVSVVMRPVVSKMPSGTTLRVELLAERRGSELRADVTAEAETVHVRVWLDGVEALDRHFLARRMSEVDLLGQAIEASGRDPVESGALRAAAALIAPRAVSGGAVSG